jgi:hypothetical protein
LSVTSPSNHKRILRSRPRRENFLFECGSLRNDRVDVASPQILPDCANLDTGKDIARAEVVEPVKQLPSEGGALF